VTGFPEFPNKDDVEKANNLKQVLCAFEKMFGLKFNFHKSEIFSFVKAKERADHYVSQFGCKEGVMLF
jgi:hypothetical protein